jgi:hypothetical protein
METMSAFKIYLAGPIRGLTYDESEDWRSRVAGSMPDTIACYSPLRAKHFLRAHGRLGLGGAASDTYPENPLSTARGILTRDHFDCMTSDLIFCNLLGATAISIGTVMEIAWAWAYRKPLVVCIEPDNLHDHPMIREVTGFACGTIDEGVSLVKTVLLPQS